MPTFNPKAPVFKSNAEEAPIAERSRDAGSTSAPATASQPAAAPRPEGEDYGYTYLPPAQHRYELDADNKSKDDPMSRYLLRLGLQAAAALSIGFLAMHSNLPYILGLTRKKRE
ncbi:MAG: hypothetical protein AAB320_10975 [Elusimicrobiota bacterium]